MSAWHTVLQDASYKDVRFDVERIEERNGKSLAEHARPFVQGVDLEDMGTTGREVQISAVFYGKGYHARLLKLLTALEEPGGGVLVHPVWGRLQNMIAASWSYRHEADYVDYAALDVTFREAAEAQEIFVFENAFLMELERLIGSIDTYREAAFGFIDTVLAVRGGVSALWGSALGLWSAGAGVFAAVRSLFDFDDIAFPSRGGYRAAAFQTASRRLFADLDTMVRQGLAAGGNGADGGSAARRRYDAAAALADDLATLPARVLSGGQSVRTERITARQMQPVAQALRLLSLAALCETAAQTVEDYGEETTAADLMHINRDLRRRTAAEIAALRATEEVAYAAKDADAPAVRTASYQAAEALRGTAGRLNALIAAAINRKPPLLVRTAPFDGTLRQIAHAFYADHRRAPELVHLNPHIAHPSFVAAGTPVNCYAK